MVVFILFSQEVWHWKHKNVKLPLWLSHNWADPCYSADSRKTVLRLAINSMSILNINSFLQKLWGRKIKWLHVMKLFPGWRRRTWPARLKSLTSPSSSLLPIFTGTKSGRPGVATTRIFLFLYFLCEIPDQGGQWSLHRFTTATTIMPVLVR